MLDQTIKTIDVLLGVTMSAIGTTAAPSAVLPSNDQTEIIDFIQRLGDRGRGVARPTARIVDADGVGVVIPSSMFDVLAQAAEALKAGLAVTVAPQHLVLSTQEAADMLHISRTTLVRLLETGAIAFDKPSRHRKVRLADLLDYRERQRRAASDALDDMVADAQRLGLYDDDSRSETTPMSRRLPADA